MVLDEEFSQTAEAIVETGQALLVDSLCNC